MNNILEHTSKIFFQPSLQKVGTQTNQDPVSQLLSSLHSCRGVEVNIKSKDDVFIEDFFQKNKSNSVLVNVEKDLNFFSTPMKFPHFFGNQRQAGFPNQQQKAILSKLKNIPIYTIVNGFNEIVIASPRSMPPKNSLEWLYDKYYEHCLWKGDKGSVNLGLFFVNKEDAELYLQEICKKDPKGAEDLGINVKTVGLDSFYELNRTSKPQMQAKLVADLEEVDFIINEHSNKKNLSFHPKQKHKSYWFQGNPIYLIKTTESTDLVDKRKFSLAQYKFNSSLDNSSKVFLFKKNDAYKVWNLYKLKNKQLNLPEIPNLELYNLENYLLDLEKSDLELIEKTVFVPPYDSYVYSKKLIEKANENSNISVMDKVHNYVNTKVKSMQRFYKGLIWLFTSDTLPNEDNSW